MNPKVPPESDNFNKERLVTVSLSLYVNIIFLLVVFGVNLAEQT
jgi:hypothetical protein